MMIAAATLAGENLFREWPTLANRDCLFYEIWITFSDYLEEKIKVCDQPLPIRLICPRLMAGNSSLYAVYRSHSGDGWLPNTHTQRLAAEALKTMAVIFLWVLCTESG